MEELITKVYTPEDVYNYADSGNVDNLRLALDYGNNSIHWYSNENGLTALIVAAHQGHTACIYVLLDRGANIESKDNLGFTALLVAAYRGHNECIGGLLDRGADIESKTDLGKTALLVATQQGHTECIGVLLDRGADIKSKECDGGTALDAAAQKGYTACIDLLLDRGADIGSKDSQGLTALHFAANRDHRQCIVVLVDRGADIESKSNGGITALHIAALNSRTECLVLLLDRGADIDTTTDQGNTALHLAAREGHIESTRLLLDRQAIINEAKIENIQHPECKQMIRDEILHRLRRAAFDSFISHHIEYPRLIHNIYSTCYPSGDLRVTSPAIGWDRAEAVRNKYYFDEVLFYVHVYVASVCTRSKTKQSASSVIAVSQCREHLASSSDKTWTLMTVLSSYLKEYLIE